MQFLKMLDFRPICRHVNRCYRRWPISDVSFSPIQTISTIWPRNQPLLSRFLKFGSLATLSTTIFATCAYADELDEMTESFRARYSRSENPILLEYYKSYRDAIAREQNIEFKSFWESTDRDLGYVNSFIANAKAVCAEAIDMYLNYRFRIEDTIRDDFETPPDKLLPDISPLLQSTDSITLVLDMNETLVHSDSMKKAIISDEHSFKRPGLDAFLDRLYGCCELVIYTDQRSLDANYLIYKLEKGGGFQYCLSRRHNTYQDGKRYRDLSKLNRDPSRVLYVSGHALENCLQPENCLPIKPWKKEMDDNTLMDILPFIEYVVNESPDDIRPILASFKGKDVAAECKKYERRMQELEESRMEEGDV